jgi:nucleoside-diphosphate-sugar epimerase
VVRIVLTGGTGVLGRAALPSLVAAGHDVLAVVRSPRAAQVAEALGARTVRGNVLDVASLEAAYDGADAVVNLATAVPVGHNAFVPGAWRRHDQLRTSGVANVVEAARRAGVRRVVQESVSFVYAEQGEDWITEQSPVEITPMTEPAAVGESHIQDYACGSRIGVVLRFGIVVGDDGQTRHWLRSTEHGHRIGIGHPADWTHVIHTDDLGSAVLASLHAPSGVYNVGAEPVQRHDLVQGYADAAGVESRPFVSGVVRWWMGPRFDAPSRSLRVCSDHFAAQTGWRATRPKFDATWLDAAQHGASAQLDRLHHLHR